MKPVLGQCGDCACWDMRYTARGKHRCARHPPSGQSTTTGPASDWPMTASYDGCWDHIPKETKP